MATVHDLIIAHDKWDAQRYRSGKCKVILGPAACTFFVQPAGKKA